MPYYRPCPLCGATLDPGEKEMRLSGRRKSRPGAATPGRLKGGNRFADQHFHLYDNRIKTVNQGGKCNV